MLLAWIVFVWLDLIGSGTIPPDTHYCHPSLVAAVFSLGHSKMDPLHRQVAAATHSGALPLRPDIRRYACTPVHCRFLLWVTQHTWFLWPEVPDLPGPAAACTVGTVDV